jgi:hydroxymethylpyrimidine/phosphomethylpyrimidine kinase
MNQTQRVPVVLAFAGSDPTGGAGIQADIEAMASLGCHAAPIITAVTVQDTTNVMAFIPQKAELVFHQARAVLEDIPIAAIKIGVVGSVEIIEALHVLLTDYPTLPVILDPVIHAGGGHPLADEEMIAAIKNLLLPLATIVTPNNHEARALAYHADNQNACAMALLECGVDYVLITGTHENTTDVVNVLYGNNRLLERFTWKRLQGSFHGSGCTLAAALSGLLAQGREPLSAVREAQNYTWLTLKSAHRLGMGQQLPNRFFWVNREP